MLRQAVLLPNWSKFDPGQPSYWAEWLTPLVENIARQGIREFLLVDASGPIHDLNLPRPVDLSGMAEREPGSPPPPRYRIGLARPRGAKGEAGALAALLPRLDEQFLLVDATTFLDINYLDLLTSGPAVSMTVARHPDACAGSWGSAAVLRRGVLAGVDSDADLARDLVPRLDAAGEVVSRSYLRPLVSAEQPGALDRVRRLMHRPAVFLDRDGVLNVDREYVSRIDQFAWIDGAREAVKLFNDAGWYVFVVTNQSGIARGLYPESDVATLHAHMESELRAVGAFVDRIEYCPYHAEGTVAAYRRDSPRRKPGPGMLLACFDALPVDRSRSFLVGDKATDVAAATAAGISGHLFTGGSLVDFVAPLLAADSGGRGRPGA